MLNVLFTSEYELFGNGRGCPLQHMITPTNRMLDLLNHYGAKLTLFAEAAEIMCFGEYLNNTGHDSYYYEDVIKQLRRTVETGHDVQLHLHASYCNARHQNGYWQQDYSELDLAQLPYERQKDLIRRYKDFLETTLRSVKSDYSCHVFRASNWSMQPSSNILRALKENDITIDTSVWKYGVFQKPVKFDYRDAHCALVPWPIAADEVCNLDSKGALLEFPIYCEKQPIWYFLSPHRIYRAIDRRINPLWRDPELADYLKQNRSNTSINNSSASFMNKLRSLFQRYPLKMDFNQCTGRQILAGLRRAERQYGSLDMDLPFVVFGHSRTFNRANATSLKPLLQTIADNQERYQFATFTDFSLPQFREYWMHQNSSSGKD